MLRLRKSLWKCLKYTYRDVRVTARIHRVYLVEHPAAHFKLQVYVYPRLCLPTDPYGARISNFPSRSQCRSLLDFPGLHQATYGDTMLLGLSRCIALRWLTLHSHDGSVSINIGKGAQREQCTCFKLTESSSQISPYLLGKSKTLAKTPTES